MQAVEQGSGPSRQTRRVSVAVVDLDGNFISAAQLQCFVDKTPFGACVTSARMSSFEFDDKGIFSVEAVYGGAMQTLSAAPGQHQLTFKFPRQPHGLKTLMQAGARCPDGSTGFPCVSCTVGKDTIRICV